VSRFEYRCTECGRTYDRDAVRYLCPTCGESHAPGQPLRGVLEAVFDAEFLTDASDPGQPDWSRFSAVESSHFPDFPVGNTPLAPAPGLGAELGLDDLWIKNDGLNPSGSLKDRASFLMVAEARRLGEDRLIAASTGNAASALAAVCAASGKQALIFVPENAPRAKLVQMLLHGARVVRVKGSYDDAFRLSLEYTRERGGLNRNTAYHPLTIEGKKTVSLEIFAQLKGTVPDSVIVPVGDGVIISGVHKGFADLRRAGLAERLPRLFCVQAERSDAIHHLITTGEYRNANNPATVADSISVSAPSNARMAARAVQESQGGSVVVPDEAILAAQVRLARGAGVFAEPAAAAAAAGLEALVAQGRIERGERTVLLVTGHGLKDIDAPLARLALPDPVEPDLAALGEA